MIVRNKCDFRIMPEREVCDFLRGEGFAADMQVGCSSYRIDIGVRAAEGSIFQSQR